MSDSSFEEDSLEDGGQDESDIRIRPPKEPEVNPDIYQDTIQMVSRGFLIAAADLNDIPFVFKSLNHHEYEMIRLLTGMSVNSKGHVPPRFWDVFLAYMVLFVDGQNVLVARQKNLSQLAHTFRDLPHAAKARLIRQLSELNRKASASTLLVEAYATETYSRWRWAQVQGLDLAGPSLTGIEGTDKIGLCYAQLTWRAINYYEDIRYRHDTEWDNAKFIGGCFAGKSIQKIYDKDQERRKKEREDRWTKKDLMIRHVLFGDPLEEPKRYNGAQVVKVASTVEELAEQVEKSLRGEKDWHDEVVQEYESNVRTNFTKKQEQLQNLIQESRRVNGDVSGGTSLTGLTAKEVAQKVQRPVVEAEPQEPISYLEWNLREGNVPAVDKPTSNAIPLQSSRNTGKPWRP